MNERPDFFEKCTNLKQPYYLIKIHWSVKFREIEKDTIVLFSYQVNQAFYCTKSLNEMENEERYRYHIFSC